MEKLKQWVAMTVLAVLAIGAGGWFLWVAGDPGFVDGEGNVVGEALIVGYA